MTALDKVLENHTKVVEEGHLASGGLKYRSYAISGAKSIPISRLKVGSFHMVDRKRLQVNSSASRYQRELAYLVSVI